MVMRSKLVKKGAVSIFVVIFATILATIIVLGFVRLMILDQQRAISSDLADSAYDSALAGLEDAKRAMIAYERDLCPAGASGSANCEELRNKYLSGNHCGAVQGVLKNGSDDSEVKILTTKTGSGDLEQAYTCAKIRYYTEDYERETENRGEVIMLPLSANSAFRALELKWSGEIPGGVSDPGTFSDAEAKNPSWDRDGGNKVPALMLQYISGGQARTLFLKPRKHTGVIAFADAYFDNDQVDQDAHIRLLNPPVAMTNCKVSGKNYECRSKLIFKGAGSGEEIAAGSQDDFLKINKLYSAKAKFHMRFAENGGKRPNFNGIQPEVDVTGRANYVFRRIKARVEFTGGRFPYPTAALSVDGDICKDFEVTERRIKQKVKDGTSCVDTSTGSPRP